MKPHTQTYLEPEVYKRVLSVARSYYQDLNKIKQIENDCIMATSRPEANGGRCSYVSDPTYSVTQQIEKHTRLLRARTDAVWKVLHKFKNEHQEIIKQNVFEGIKIIYCNTTMSERSVKTIRKNFITLLAVELGEIL